MKPDERLEVPIANPKNRRRIERAVLAVLAALALGFVVRRYRLMRAEDFVYYYCAGRTSAAGFSPYDAAPYQDCMAAVLGAPNPNVSRSSGSAYPPPAILLFRALSAVPYPAAFALWNALLLAASFALLRLSARSPRDWLALLAWPGFLLCWTYHKLTLALVAVMLGGMSLAARGDEAAGGLLLAFLAIQPQWLAAAGLYLAARRRLRALAVLAASGMILFAASAFAAHLGPWFASAAEHANAIIGFDNQSLFLEVYKAFRGFVPDFDPSVFQAARYGVSLALVALAWRVARAGEDLALYLCLIVLALPYSHGSDSLWAFPLYLAAAARAAARCGLGPRASAAAVLFVSLALVWFVGGGFTPGHLHYGSWDSRQGYLSCAVAAFRLATASSLARRASQDSREG
jgi:hypothetical protein